MAAKSERTENKLPLADHIDVRLQDARKQLRAMEFFPELLNCLIFILF